MQPGHKEDIFSRILIEPGFRFLRHIILFIFIFFISAGLIWYTEEENMTSLNKYAGLLFYLISLLVGIYFNIYILIPRLLLENKWLFYFISLTGLVVLIVAVIIMAQNIFYEEENQPIPHTDYFIVTMSILSSVLSFTLLFIGTTTFVIFKYWLKNIRQANEIETFTLHAELKLLENQINPHFLFNMLNNANIMIREDPDMAAHIVFKLEEMLRYQINDYYREKVYLTEEILFLTDYLELEKTRRDHFEYIIVQEGNMDGIQVPSLLFIIFVENAVKHNPDSEAISYVHISFTIKDNKLTFICKNSIPGKPYQKKPED